jgi:glycolate oxidase iron-sulfur subunit
MRAVEEGRLAANSAAFERHIDRCLGCRACEAACPAGVEYGQLLEASRNELMQGKTERGFSYVLLRLALKHIWLHPARLRLAFTLSRWFRNLGIPRLLVRSKLARLISRRFEFALALLDSSRPTPSLNSGASERVGKSNPTAADVVLFKACVTDGLFQRVNDATIRVLEMNYCQVATVDKQVCCGALHAHAGDLEGARVLARRNLDALESYRTHPLITNAGGCGAMLASYGHLLADDKDYAERARRFSFRVRDLGQQLEESCRVGAAIGSEPVTYDSSCHLLHGQHGALASLQMLRAIPDLELVPLNESDVCCGGAGVYNLMEPDLSERVLRRKLDQIKDSGAAILATGNAGCQMQIGAGAHFQGMDLLVCHPVELLDESYRRAGFYEKGETDHR